MTAHEVNNTISLVACGNNANSANKSNASSTETGSKLEVSESEAKEIVVNYLSGEGEWDLELLLERGTGADKISNLKIANLERNTNNNYYRYFDVYGNFYTIDKYGKVTDHKSFSVGITVDWGGKPMFQQHTLKIAK